MSNKLTAQELKTDMAQCTGSMQYHKLTMLPLKATDGMKMVAEKAEAFWLVDAIASYQAKPKIEALDIQFWYLEVKKNTAVLYCIADSGMPRIVEQYIGFTDFPNGTWKFYVTNGIIMLPSEY